MQQAIHLDLPRHVQENTRVAKRRPDYAKHYIPGADCQVIPLPGCEIARYHISHFNFRLEFLELEAGRDTDIRVRIRKPSTFLTFNIEGTLGFGSPEGQPLWDVPENTFFPTYKGAGPLVLHLAKGIHRFAVCTFHPDYLLSEAEHFPELGRLFESIGRDSPDPLVFPYCAMSRSVHMHLEAMRTYDASQPVIRANLIFHKLVECLVYHHRLVRGGNQLKDIGLGVHLGALRDYVQEHVFTDQVDSVGAVAEALGVTEKKVQELANRLYGVALHQHVIATRMNKAKELIVGTDRKIKDIAVEVGYRSREHFFRAFKRHFNTSPNNLRKGGK